MPVTGDESYVSSTAQCDEVALIRKWATDSIFRRSETKPSWGQPH
jgi:hypothetical protein